MFKQDFRTDFGIEVDLNLGSDLESRFKIRGNINISDYHFLEQFSSRLRLFSQTQHKTLNRAFDMDFHSSGGLKMSTFPTNGDSDHDLNQNYNTFRSSKFQYSCNIGYSEV